MNIESKKQEATEVRFTVYGEPVSKERPRTVREKDRYGRKTVHTYTPSKTKNQEETIGWVYKSTYKDRKFMKGEALSVAIDFFIGIPKNCSPQDQKLMEERKILPADRKDIDNMEKTVLDGLNKVAYEDDSQIVELTGRKFYSVKPRTEITIKKVDCIRWIMRTILRKKVDCNGI